MAEAVAHLAVRRGTIVRAAATDSIWATAAQTIAEADARAAVLLDGRLVQVERELHGAVRAGLRPEIIDNGVIVHVHQEAGVRIRVLRTAGGAVLVPAGVGNQRRDGLGDSVARRRHCNHLIRILRVELVAKWIAIIVEGDQVMTKKKKRERKGNGLNETRRASSPFNIINRSIAYRS